MRRVIFILVFLTAIFNNCKETTKNSSASDGNGKFQQLSDEFLKGYLDWRPELSVYLAF
jgi:hypothetical protein